MSGVRMKSVKKGVVTTLAGMLILGLSLPAMALEVREIKPEPAPGPVVKLAVGFTPDKAIYKVGEAVKFKVQANKACYLYIFGINEKAKMAYVLLPNVKEPDNRVQVGAEKVIPGEKIEFFGDKPGVERIVYVASTKAIDLNTGQYDKSGAFMTTTPEAMIKDLKAIRLRPAGGAEQVSDELNLTVIGKVENPKPKAEAAAFISTDKTEYKLGEEVKILFGADKKGWIYLYTMEPEGRKVFLKKQEIDGEKFYTVKAEAADPRGEHKLIAVYSQDGKVENEKAGAQVTGRIEKGLVLVEDKSLPYAVYHFNIID